MIDKIQSIEDLIKLSTTGSLAAVLGSDVYFVGGGVRDLLSGRECDDFDFVLGSREEEIPRSFAAKAGGSFFWLDKARKQSRVVVKAPHSTVTFDFSPLRGDTIQEDLSLRDFTINAMAVCLGGASGEIIDPLGGREDIERREIKKCSDSCFVDDPLRLLRAVRFAVTFGFRIEKHTWLSLVDHVHLIAGVAKERVRDEMFKILAAPSVSSSLRILGACGLLEKVFPSISVAGADMEAGIHAAQLVEDVAVGLSKGNGRYKRQLQEYLNSASEAGVSIFSLLKLSAFLKPAVDSSRVAYVVDDMRLAKKTKLILRQLLDDLDLPFRLLSANPTERAMYRFFSDHKAGLEMVIAALADGKCQKDLAERLIEYYFGRLEYQMQELLSGNEIMHHFKLEPGTYLGEAIGLLRAAEAAGLVNSKAEALAFLGKKLLTKPMS